jgi:hypothetical protein
MGEDTAKPLFTSLAAALIGKYLAPVFPAKWLISAMLVAFGIMAAFWICERRGLAALSRPVRGTIEPAIL